MELGRFFTSLALAGGVAGGALAQQAETAGAARAAEDRQHRQFLVPGCRGSTAGCTRACLQQG